MSAGVAPELYHWEPNAFHLKPLIALAEKGVAFVSNYFDPTRLEQFGAGFPSNVESRLQLEREGPLLLHAGELISSSFFMLEYIAEALPGPTLMPRTAYDRYRARACGQTNALGLAGPVIALGCLAHLAPALRAQPRAALRARFAGIEPLERRAAWEALLEDRDSAATDALRAQLQTPLARIEAVLERSPWLAGSDYSIADIDTYALLAPLPALTPGLANAGATPRILDFLARVQARPAVRTALNRSRTGRPHEAFVPGPESSRWG